MTVLFDRIRFAREGAAVERCHVHPHLLRYSVGQHSLDMVTLIVFTWREAFGEEPRAELLIAAAFHDLAERIFGDLPQPAKMLIGDTIARAEAGVLKWLGNPDLTETEQVWLKTADRVELLLWSLEEAVGRGNKEFQTWVNDYLDYFNENLPPPTFLQVIQEAVANAAQRLDFTFVKSIAEL